MCHQAVAQYPESFNDHKETHWQASKEAAIVPMLVPAVCTARTTKQAHIWNKAIHQWWTARATKQFTVGQPSTRQLKCSKPSHFSAMDQPSTRQLKCSKLTPLFGRRPQGRNRTNQLNSTTLLPTTRQEATSGSRNQPNSTILLPTTPGKFDAIAPPL